MKRLVPLAIALMLTSSPAIAQEQAILGTMPAYPGATRPLPQWETPRLAIAMTPDKPEAVIDYYLSRLSGSGWTPARDNAPAALAAAYAGQPAWITFRRPGYPALILEVAQGQQPKTGQMLTLIYYQQTQFKP